MPYLDPERSESSLPSPIFPLRMARGEGPAKLTAASTGAPLVLRMTMAVECAIATEGGQGHRCALSNSSGSSNENSRKHTSLQCARHCSKASPDGLLLSLPFYRETLTGSILYHTWDLCLPCPALALCLSNPPALLELKDIKELGIPEGLKAALAPGECGPGSLPL